MKKMPLCCFLLVWTVSLSFTQIYRGESETKNGGVSFSLHYVEYADYRYLLYIDGVSVFIEEDQIIRLETILQKFTEWETMADAEQISLTKTIDSITFSSFHFNHTFFREPVVFYFVFTGGPEKISAGAGSDIPAGDENTGGSTPPAPTRYTLFIDTTLERIVPFRLGSKTVREMQEALSPEKLTEALDAYNRQKALEEMFQ